MRVNSTQLKGPLLIEPVVHGDERGFFLETFRAEVLADAGIGLEFVQENHSRSRGKIVRGMHFQPGQWKLVRCVRGAIFDAIVDIRPDSPTFGEWEGFRLDDQNHRQILVPDGFAHGFCVLSEEVDVAYKVSTYYDPKIESGFRFDDAAVAVDWPLPISELQASARDREAPSLAELKPVLSSTSS